LERLLSTANNLFWKNTDKCGSTLPLNVPALLFADFVHTDTFFPIKFAENKIVQQPAWGNILKYQ